MRMVVECLQFQCWEIWYRHMGSVLGCDGSEHERLKQPHIDGYV
jgi:hypothetical protein